MKYLELSSDSAQINVSKLALGTAKFGKTIQQQDAYQLMNMYCEAGGNCIDTGRAYVNGRSEEIVGQWIKQRNNRHDLVVSTKCCHPTSDNPQIGRLTRKDMEDDLNNSLRALQTDYIDVYWVHKDDRLISAEDVMENIERVVKSGKARMIGCSNWHVDRIIQANQFANESGMIPFATSQIQWSLADTKEELFAEFGAVIMSPEEYAWYYQQQMPVFAYASQAQGFFTKAAINGIDQISEKLLGYYGAQDNLLRLQKLKKYSTENSISISALVLGYIVYNKLPGVAIIGCNTPEQLMSSLLVMHKELSTEQADRLYRIG